jgi:hypothetical protein
MQRDCQEALSDGLVFELIPLATAMNDVGSLCNGHVQEHCATA